MASWDAIFPTPVMRSSLGRAFTEHELAFFERIWASSCRENVTNFRSADTRVLDAPEMEALRAVVQDHHTNSLISGSLYVFVKKEADSICFYRNSPAQLLVTDDHANIFNAPIHRMPVDVGDLVLFPSALLHDVEPTAGGHIRVSVAFNAFIKGEIGSEEWLNSLTV